MDRVEAIGRASGEELSARLAAADLLCAPSLAGESFGMVLTEAFAAGTPVLASNIAGYADVVSDDVDGVLVPPADPQRLAEELLHLSDSPGRLARMGEAARSSAERFAWPRVAAQVEEVYDSVQELPEPSTRGARVFRQAGLLPADGSTSVPARRLPSLDPAPAQAAGRHRLARRFAL